MKRLALSTILLVASALLASGCVYKMNIQQGNYLVAESVSQLKEGMTRSQVRFLLGTPMVPDAFDNSRWDYYYFFSSRQYKQPLKRRLTVYFEDERVQRYENQGVPTQTDLQQLERDLRKAMYAEFPHLAAIDQITPADIAGVRELAAREIKTDNAKLLPTVTDFYMTNPIARASAIMAECSQMQMGLKQAAE